MVWVKDWPQRTVANDADVMLKDVPAVLNLDANTRLAWYIGMQLFVYSVNCCL